MFTSCEKDEDCIRTGDMYKEQANVGVEAVCCAEVTIGKDPPVKGCIWKNLGGDSTIFRQNRD